jgi:hypothetical protein
MPQGENLSVQRCAGSKCFLNRGKERENDRKHGLSKLSRRPFKFNWGNENRVFGRHCPIFTAFGEWPRFRPSFSVAPKSSAVSSPTQLGLDFGETGFAAPSLAMT